MRVRPFASCTKVHTGGGPRLLRGGGSGAEPRPLTSISCTCSSLVAYICCRDSSSSLFLSSRVFPSSAARCKSGGAGGGGRTTNREHRGGSQRALTNALFPEAGLLVTLSHPDTGSSQKLQPGSRWKPGARVLCGRHFRRKCPFPYKLQAYSLLILQVSGFVLFAQDLTVEPRLAHRS